MKRVNGEGYRSDDVLAAELLDKLRALAAAHRGDRNFYNEWPHAAGLGSSLPENGLVPKLALYGWVFTITQCYIGNGLGYFEGVDQQAAKYYKNYIDSFTEREVVQFLNLFAVPEFTVDFATRKADRRARALAAQLEQRCQDVFVKQGLALIQSAAPLTLRSLANTTAFKNVLKNLPVKD